MHCAFRDFAEVFVISRKTQTTDNKRFFAVFLDTTARVANFTGPRHSDPSLKFVPKLVCMYKVGLVRLSQLKLNQNRNRGKP